MSATLDTLSFMATEALAIVDVSEDEADALCGFDMVRDLRTRAALRYPAPADLDACDRSDMHRWIVAETLKYVGQHDRLREVYSAVWIAWRNACEGWTGKRYGWPEREAYVGLSDEDRADLAYQLKRELRWDTETTRAAEMRRAA